MYVNRGLCQFPTDTYTRRHKLRERCMAIWLVCYYIRRIHHAIDVDCSIVRSNNYVVKTDYYLVLTVYYIECMDSYSVCMNYQIERSVYYFVRTEYYIVQTDYYFVITDYYIVRMDYYKSINRSLGLSSRAYELVYSTHRFIIHSIRLLYLLQG